MSELQIEVIETLTPNSCSKLIIKIIKYLLYNSQQIPVNYELLSGFIKRAKNNMDSKGQENKILRVSSYKKMILEQFFSQVMSSYNNFEDTFKNLEFEFSKGPGLKEIIVMIGSTVLMPKKLFRIEVPILQYCSCSNVNSLQKNLTNAFRRMIDSDKLHSYLMGHIDLGNIYILIRRTPVKRLSTDWLLPKDNFKIPKVKPFVIRIDQQQCSVCACSDYTYYSQESNNENSESEEIDISWFQPKLSLKGFKDLKVDGTSAFNFVLG